MGAKLGSGGGPIADINVTPLIDVVLVLLVVFMVITPMLQSGQPVELPVATQSTTVKDAGENITISITVDKGWWVEQEQVDRDTIIDQINWEYRLNPSRALVIKADTKLEYQQVWEVVDILAQNRMTSVMLATAKE